MGGSGGSGSRWPTPEELRRATSDVGNAAAQAGFGTQLSGELGELLASVNDRDNALVAARVEEISSCVEDEIEESISVLYGGSVAKHTYVDGLSDIDTLLIFNRTELAGQKPLAILKFCKELLASKLGEKADVTTGSLAVTITYKDGMIVQALPALRTKDGLKIAASWAGDRWADVDPEAFQRALTRRNQQCNNKLVPTIKLTKAVNATFPESLQLSGYHIEALAITAFRNYSGDMTTAAMLPYFFDQASRLVLQPIKDRSGQSIHVDGYMGKPKSAVRHQASQVLSRVYRKMRNASAAGSIDQWRSIFE